MLRLLIVIAIVIVIGLSFITTANASIACKYARFNPTFYVICFWEMMMDYWLIDDYYDFSGDD